MKVHVFFWALCCFNSMSCVFSQWSPNLVSVVFVTNKIRSKLVSFHFGWRVLPYYPRGRDSLIVCRWGCCLLGERQNLEGIGEAVAYGAKRLHTRENNMMPVVNGWIPWSNYVVVWILCDNLPCVRYYGFGNYIVSTHRL